MRKTVISLGLALILLGCNKGSKFGSGMRDFGGVVDFSRFPAVSKGVAGYNLYFSDSQAGKFTRINDGPVAGGRIIVPSLELGKEYYFKMTAVGVNGMEGKPGPVFKRKAAALSAGLVKPD